MAVVVSVRQVNPRLLAAVRRSVQLGQVGSAWKPALDQVWAFLRSQPGLRTDGHNVFLYHHPTERGAPMTIDFGVEVTRVFEPSGEVHAVETPTGEVAMATHHGGYEHLKEAHDAIRAWAAANRRTTGRQSWEIYGDWADDPAKLETTVVHLLD